MQNFPCRFLSRYVVLLVAWLLTLNHCAKTQAQSIDIIHTFNGATPANGDLPYSGLTEDSGGNFYGTNAEGGALNSGTVYRLSPNKSGGFTETVLYTFKGGSADGAEPHSSLFRDAAGNLYGTTVTGGVVGSTCNAGAFASPIGCGIIFKLTPTATGPWKETVLHRFSGPDGGNSFSGLIRDAAGSFYGATIAGGSAGVGVVFKLSLTAVGWKETVLHHFTGGADGALPFIASATLAMDTSGNLYGSTYKGGATNAGTVFRLSRPAITTSAWTEKILYTFKGGSDGSEPFTGVILDESGNVYGTTTFGGPAGPNGGIVFELIAAKGYAKATLHNFSRFTDPAEDFPNALTMDANGNLWGETEYALFELRRETNGWTEWVPWNWESAGAVGFTPVVIDSHGDVWGTVTWGGWVFKVVP